jgi:hypothetical protein
VQYSQAVSQSMTSYIESITPWCHGVHSWHHVPITRFRTDSGILQGSDAISGWEATCNLSAFQGGHFLQRDFLIMATFWSIALLVSLASKLTEASFAEFPTSIGSHDDKLPDFCHGTPCPPFKVLKKTSSYEFRQYSESKSLSVFPCFMSSLVHWRCSHPTVRCSNVDRYKCDKLKL